MESIININELCFSYRSFFRPWLRVEPVLKNLNFDVLKGETLGIIGGNGSGKSTLMKLLAGILSPNAGMVQTDATVQLLSLQVGFMPELSGRENCYLSGMLLGRSSDYVKQGLERVIEFSELEKFIDEPIRTYSSGMKARLGFAIGLMADPEVLLIDEAFSVGDKSFQKKSKRAIEERMATQRSFVLVSHSDSMLREYCARSIWLDNGEIRYIGDTAATLAEYAKFQTLGRQ